LIIGNKQNETKFAHELSGVPLIVRK